MPMLVNSHLLALLLRRYVILLQKHVEKFFALGVDDVRRDDVFADRYFRMDLVINASAIALAMLDHARRCRTAVRRHPGAGDADLRGYAARGYDAGVAVVHPLGLAAIGETGSDRSVTGSRIDLAEGRRHRVALWAAELRLLHLWVLEHLHVLVVRHLPVGLRQHRVGLVLVECAAHRLASAAVQASLEAAGKTWLLRIVLGMLAAAAHDRCDVRADRH